MLLTCCLSPLPPPLRRPWGPGRVDQSLWGSLPLESQRVRMNIELSEDSILNTWRELTCDAELRGWLGEDRERVKECQWEGDRESYHSPLGYTIFSQTPLDLSVSWASLGGVSECVLNWVLTLVVTEVWETEETITNSGVLGEWHSQLSRTFQKRKRLHKGLIFREKSRQMETEEQ